MTYTSNVDAFCVEESDGITRSLDEHYGGMNDVKEDPYGAWLAIQNQASRIAELEADKEAQTYQLSKAFGDLDRAEDKIKSLIKRKGTSNE